MDQQAQETTSVGTVTNTPAPAPVASQPVQPAQPAARRRRSSNGSSARKNTTSTAEDSSQRAITITLPKETLAWYEQQAAAAPFEPSVQKFLAWELRELAKARQVAEKQAAEISQ